MKHRLEELLMKYAVRDGHLRYVYVLLCAFVGVWMLLIDLYHWHTGWLYIVGLGIGAFGGYSAQAYVLKIRPFDKPPYPPEWLAERKPTQASEPDVRKESK